MNHRPFPPGVRVADAERFVFSHGRLLERRRVELLLHGGGHEGVLAALGAYRNPDGGFGHGLEPDLRSPVSEPLSTLTALDLLAALDLPDHPWVRGGLEWAASIAGLDGSIPFVTAPSLEWPHAPWVQHVPGGSHLTYGFAAAALRTDFTGGWTDAVADWCRLRLSTGDGLPAYEAKYALRFLTAEAAVSPGADGTAGPVVAGLRDRLGPEGSLPVDGGAEDERLHPLDLADDPWRGPWETTARGLFTEEQLRADLTRVAAGQQADGGWQFDWPAWCPGQDLDWRGVRTVEALRLLSGR